MHLDDKITLTSGNGDEINFDVIAGISLLTRYPGFYAILVPEKGTPGCEEMGDDEALVFRVDENSSGDGDFSIVDDDDIIEMVFAKYHQLLEEQRR